MQQDRDPLGFQENKVPRPITQQEAAEMIELWTRTSETNDPPTLDLRDVIETLHISEAEGTRLLTQVRRQAPAAKQLSATSVILHTLLALSLLASISAFCSVLSWTASGIAGASELRIGFVAFLWTFGWLFYYRRPVKRFFAGFGRRLVEGK
jgi:hypothetical protein